MLELVANEINVLSLGMRYFIEFSYKGTAYNGWQKQNNALTVQEVLEKAMTTYFRRPIALTGSSRTDTGVHAEQQFAHFDSEEEILSTGKAINSLNGMLPYDVAVRGFYRVEDDINSRFAATHRRYEYRISRTKSPFLIDQVYVCKADFSIDKLNEAAELLLRYSDFESFSKIHTEVNNFRCAISEAVWRQEGELLIFSIQSNRFLRGMVRALVGTQLMVGSGKIRVSDFEEIIKARDRKKAGPQAPAEGLFLVEVGYPEELFERS